jgi:hypothetical protein
MLFDDYHSYYLLREVNCYERYKIEKQIDTWASHTQRRGDIHDTLPLKYNLMAEDSNLF